MSKTKTLPSVVTAARTVLEYGAHLTSPTLAPKSNMKSGSLMIERNEISAIEQMAFNLNRTFSCPPKF